MPRAVYGVKWRCEDQAPDRQRLAFLYCRQFWKMLPRCRDGDLEAAGPFQQAQGDAACADILPCPFLR
jgi:hypothetical protein